MKTLLHKAGRAWYFIAKNIPGEHFVIDSTMDVPGFLKNAENKLKNFQGELKVTLQDIEGCYPNMPKDVIIQAARDVCSKLQDKCNYEGV